MFGNNCIKIDNNINEINIQQKFSFLAWITIYKITMHLPLSKQKINIFRCILLHRYVKSCILHNIQFLLHSQKPNIFFNISRFSRPNKFETGWDLVFIIASLCVLKEKLTVDLVSYSELVPNGNLEKLC